MSIKVRLALLLGSLLVVFLGVLQILRHLERVRADEMLAESAQANQLAVQHWIDLLGQPTRRLGQDYSHWVELTNYIKQPDPAWAESNLRQALANYDTHAVWLTDPEGTLLYAAHVGDGPALPLPLEPAELAGLPPAASGRQFFAESRDGLMEVWVQGVSAAAERPRGWLLVAKLWNPKYIATLARMTEAVLQLEPARPPPGPQQGSLLLLPLKDLHGATLRQLMVRFPPPDFAETLARDALAANLLVVFGLLVVTALWLGVRLWVLNPMDRITESLARENTRLIEPLRHENDEFGRVARLVETSFAQKAALQREIEERGHAEVALRESELQVRRSLELRARLARDLHDGVIQSIYAAGLGLESALSQLEQPQPAVRIPLQQCRRSLNDIIREVRGFITGLEPEHAPRQGFAQEIEALARTMQSLWPVRIMQDLDPQVALQLSASQEVHALQITRECISNALRHGEASEVRITLAKRGGLGSLTLRDNGQGFDPTTLVPADGHGLANLAIRAREMGGASQVQSEPGHGATVIVHFPLNPLPA